MAKMRVLDESDRARAELLRGEGMPASWIAEDLGCRRESIFRSGVLADPQAAAEWRSVWQSIRKSPVLYAMHREFQPAPEFQV